ncbi:sulfatase [Pelagicoccus mobilis]|uniref:Sulfatase n=1 Tax=Pelagicoccus mobilis TaxID=415221 RepID=A0A934VJY1_9BACT|nr:sulfatase [Pelagicoccus mobilis]MBK1876096.1 sulfatase [Pelagicoccus mobilis]
MLRNVFIPALLVLTTLVASLQGGDDGSSPNIVLFLVDDMGVMDTSLPFLVDEEGRPVRHALNDWYRTPNMERLAEQGIRFSDFSAHTVCSPTRASIMNGQNSARHKTTNYIRPVSNNGGEYGPPDWGWTGLAEGDVTLPRVLGAVGYRSIHIGKGHFGPLGVPGEDPVSLGFDVNVAGHSSGIPASYYGKKNFGKGINHVPDLEKYHGTDIFLTEALTLEAKDEIDRSIELGKPFFLYLSHYAVHAPFDSDPRFAGNYSESDKSKPAQAFATLIEGMDKSLGGIVDHLRYRGIAENTLIIFLGDNGTHSPIGKDGEIASSSPFRGRKGNQWEGGVRVPFIAAWGEHDADNPWQERLPIARGEVQTQMAACFDIFPTLVDLVSAPVPDGHFVDGQSLKTLFSGERDTRRRDVFLSHFPHHRTDHYFTAYREGSWKVVYHYFPELNDLDSHYELYDLDSDVGESNNLSNVYPSRLEEMMEGLIESLESLGALFPEKEGEEYRPTLPSESAY